MTWEDLVTKYHKNQSNEIGISTKTEANIQSLVLKKTLKNASYLYFGDIEKVISTMKQANL
jgi:hypothetical protein